VPTVRHLLETRRLVIGEFSCPPDDPAWLETNCIGDLPHVVFPLTPVAISQVNRGSVLITPNHTVFYDAGQLYERRLASDQGDRCVFVGLRPETLEQIAGANRLRSIHAPHDQRTYLARHLLVRRLRTESIGAEAAERAALALVSAAFDQPSPLTPATSDRTRAAHRQLAEAAKALIARSIAEPLRLASLAARLRTSRFHLARVFRSETGFSVDAYQRSLRLRAALEALPTYRDGLTSLALELGFSSHSHFTDAFRHEFGVAPSALR
jgi:AraC-like DNA-binding protein